MLLFLFCDPRKYFIFLYIEDFTHAPKIQGWGAGKFSANQPRRDSTKRKKKRKKIKSNAWAIFGNGSPGQDSLISPDFSYAEYSRQASFDTGKLPMSPS